jgi:hypothetical protein
MEDYFKGEAEVLAWWRGMADPVGLQHPEGDDHDAVIAVFLGSLREPCELDAEEADLLALKATHRQAKQQCFEEHLAPLVIDIECNLAWAAGIAYPPVGSLVVGECGVEGGVLKEEPKLLDVVAYPLEVFEQNAILGLGFGCEVKDGYTGILPFGAVRDDAVVGTAEWREAGGDCCDSGLGHSQPSGGAVSSTRPAITKSECGGAIGEVEYAVCSSGYFAEGRGPDERFMDSRGIPGLGLAGVERASAELVAAAMPGAFSPGGFGGAGSQCVMPAVGAEFEADDVKELFCVQRSSDLSGSEWAGLELVSAESEAAEVKELFCVQMSPDILGSVSAGTKCEPYFAKEPSCVQMSSDILGSDLGGLELGSAEFGASIVMELVCVQLSTDISGQGLAGVERASAELIVATKIRT